MRFARFGIPVLILSLIAVAIPNMSTAQSKLGVPEKYQSAFDDYETLLGTGDVSGPELEHTAGNLRALQGLQSRVRELILENWSEKPSNHRRHDRLRLMSEELNRRIEAMRAGLSVTKEIPLKSESNSGSTPPDFDVPDDLVDFGISETPNAALRPQGRIEIDLRRLRSLMAAHLQARSDNEEWHAEYNRLAQEMTLKQVELALEAGQMSNENRRDLQGVFEGFDRIRDLLEIRGDIEADAQATRQDILEFIATLTDREDIDIAVSGLNNASTAYAGASLAVTREINRISLEEIDPIMQRVFEDRIRRGTDAINALIRSQSGQDAPLFAIGDPPFRAYRDGLLLRLRIKELSYSTIGGNWSSR